MIDDPAIRRAMNERAEVLNPTQVAVDIAIVSLMNATEELFELAANKTSEPLVRREANDIDLAYVRLGRLLSRIRQSKLQAAE